MKKPFFSILLISYNQERFIKEAFESCINQTYNNYEIVISDDCSTDSTYSILEKLVEEYRNNNGTIHIILNQNNKNLGIGGNFQRAAEISHGQWLAMAAGDDISLPSRLEIVKNHIDTHNNIYGINTARYIINETGNLLYYNFKENYLLGADSIWHRDTFTKFKPLDYRIMSEDHVLNLRALLLGGMLQINIPTIKYRISSQNYSIRKVTNILDSKLSAIKKINYHINILKFRIDDLTDWIINHKESNDTIVSAIDKNRIRIKSLEKEKESYSKFIEVYNSPLISKLTYLIKPSQLWLHNKFIYRLYNLMKMLDFINYKSKRQTDWDLNIEGKSDDRVIFLSINDYITQNDFF